MDRILIYAVCRARMLAAIAVAGVCFAFLSSALGADWPHVQYSTKTDSYWPEPGYKWDHLDESGKAVPGNFAVHWQPGSSYWLLGQKKWPNIVSAAQEGAWEPKPGYWWEHFNASGRLIDYAVRWDPGRGYVVGGKLKWANVIASETEGQWYPAPGYAWSETDADGKPISGHLSVHWSPGKNFSYLGEIKWPHVFAANEEGHWAPGPGYTFQNWDESGRLIDFTVSWSPGMKYLKLGEEHWPHVIASRTEGQWLPAPGYSWAHTEPDGKPVKGDMSVRWVPNKRYLYLEEVKWTNIISCETEGAWKPVEGYSWVHLNEYQMPTDLEVVSVADRRKSHLRVYTQEAKGSEMADAAAKQRGSLEEHWAAYLKLIQQQNDYANWEQPPHDAYIARHPNTK